jgi:predicted transcriptional regulator
LFSHEDSINPYLLVDICLENVNQLAKYGLLQTNEDGYILSPLGKEIMYIIEHFTETLIGD